MSAGPQKSTKTPAPPQRSTRFTLYPQQPTLEEACRRAHAFASRYPMLYRWRVGQLTATVLLTPFFYMAFLSTITMAYLWASQGTDIFEPSTSDLTLRRALIGSLCATMIPLLLTYGAGLVRGLTLRLPNPGGRLLEEAQAPRLYRMLAEMAKSLDAPSVEEVRVVPEGILEIRHEPCGGPGILGRARTILVMGLPLAEELSPQQFRALVAHELAHLATHKRRFGGRVLGLRRRLAALRQAAEASALERGFWSRLPDENLLDTLDAILRRLAAATFPAIRQHEAEADAIAAAVAGREFAAAALLRQRIAGHAMVHRFHAECLRLAESSPEIAADLFERRAAAASGGFSEAQVNAWFRAELEVKDNLAESHPPLWDRLRLLGFRLENLTDFRDLLELVQPQRELGETAARYFLGDTAEALRAEYFREWAGQQAGDWRKRFLAYEGLRATAAEWENSGTAATADAAALWQTAVAVGNTRSWKAALPLAQRILEISPGHADANLLTGQLLLDEGNPAGIEALERAMKSDSCVIPVACALASRFLEGRGEQEAAGGYQKRCEAQRNQEQTMAHERSHVRATDELLTPDCPATTAQALRSALERHSSHIRRAYLMRKQLNEGDPRTLHVLGVERRLFLYENNGARANRMLLERIIRVPGMPADVLVCVVTRENRALLEKWKGVPNALLYPRRPAGWPEGVVEGQTARTAELLHHPPQGALPAQNSPAAAK